MRTRATAVMTLLFSLLASCAQHVPRELSDARLAYARALRDPASALASADLERARSALDEAERAYEAVGDAQSTRDLAYVAERRVRIAESHARTRSAETRSHRVEAEAARRYEQKTAEMQLELVNQQDAIVARRAQLAAERDRRAGAEQRGREAMAELRRIAQVDEQARGAVITLEESILFAPGKAALRQQARARLSEVARALAAGDPDAAILIEGYTDQQGDPEQNMRLSQARAEAVRAFFAARGVPAERMEAKGRGAERPVADNQRAEGRAANRRVEVVLRFPPRS